MHFPMLPLVGSINFNGMEFIHSLRYMGEGMLGILLVMLAIIGAIRGLNKIFSEDE